MREFVGLKPHANPKGQKQRQRQRQNNDEARATAKAKADPCGMTNKKDAKAKANPVQQQRLLLRVLVL
jgi:hypothetical protein